MPTRGKLVTLDTKSGETESGAGEVGGEDREVPESDMSMWDTQKEINVHGDALVPFFISPKAQTAMRTLSSWSSSETALDDGDDDEGDELVIVDGDEQERRR